MTQKTTTTTDALLARAIRRAADTKTATVRLLAAVKALAAPIAAAAKASGLRAHVELGEDLDGECEGYDVPYRLNADGDGDVWIARENTIDGDGDPIFETWRVVYGLDGLDGANWGRASRPIPRHVLILLPAALRRLAEALAAKAESQALETEKALALAGEGSEVAR